MQTIAAPELREQLNHLAEPLIELNRRLAKLRREGHHIVWVCPVEIDGVPGIKVYTDDGWVLVDMACELSNGMVFEGGEFGTAPAVEPVMSIGVLLTGDALEEEYTVEV